MECDETLNTSSETEQSKDVTEASGDNVFKEDTEMKEGRMLAGSIFFFSVLLHTRLIQGKIEKWM